MRRPRRLRPGDVVRVVAPASAVEPDRLAPTIRWLESRGYVVQLGQHVYSRHGYLAGTDQERADDLIDALMAPNVRAIIAARGGYGSMRLVPLIDWAQLRRISPKIFVGFSDLTALHMAFGQRLQWVTFHGPVISGSWDGPNGDDVLRVLGGGQGPLNQRPLVHLTATCGDVSSPWTGGNLSLVASLMGTPEAINAQGKVLYLEDVNEEAYRVDRMLTQLRASGAFRGVRAVVFGQAVGCHESAGVNVQSVFYDICGSLGVPLYWGLEAGHGARQLTVPLGWPLRITQGMVFLDNPAVT